MATSEALFEDVVREDERPLLVRSTRAIGRFYKMKPLGGFGLTVLMVILFLGVFSPWIAPEELGTQTLEDALQGPSAAHWFGTDPSGADVFSRVIYGCQITAIVGLGTVLFVAIMSLSVGIASGYFGGKVDFITQRAVDIWMSFPAILLILSLVAVLQTTTSRGFLGLGRGPTFGPDPTQGDWFWYTFPRTTIVIFVLGVVLAGGASRVVRSAAIAVTAMPYLEAARVIGASDFRAMTKHVMPNVMPTVIVLATLQLGVAIIVEATISFLGVGITNFPTWGQMLSGRTRDLGEQNPHLVIFPAVAIFLAVFGFNMLGDALRDVLDPRLRGTR